MTTRTKPRCLWCGKALRKRTYSTELKENDPPPATIYEKAVREVISRKPISYRPGSEWVSLWCGEWGGYGDNHFCGLRCGYSWAVGQQK